MICHIFCQVIDHQEVYVYWFTPLKKEGKGSNNRGSKGVAVNHEHIVAHSSVQRNFGDDVHAGIAEL